MPRVNKNQLEKKARIIETTPKSGENSRVGTRTSSSPGNVSGNGIVDVIVPVTPYKKDDKTELRVSYPIDTPSDEKKMVNGYLEMLNTDKMPQGEFYLNLSYEINNGKKTSKKFQIL